MAEQQLSPLFYLGLANGQFATTNRADLTRLFQNFDKSDHNKTIVCYFHGGLVNQNAGMEIAGKLLNDFYGAGAYPVFFVWNAGVDEIIKNNLREIFNERIFTALLDKVLQFVVGKLDQTSGERGFGMIRPADRIEVQQERRVPRNPSEPFAQENAQTAQVAAEPTEQELKQFDVALRLDPVLMAELNAIAAAPADNTRSLQPKASAHTLMSDEIVAELRADKAAVDSGSERGLLSLAFWGRAAKVFATVIKRFVQGRDHGVYTTVVEEILRAFYADKVGGLFWKITKQETHEAFGTAAECGGTAVSSEILTRLKANSAVQIVLVGHSTGAVYINEFLNHITPILDDPAQGDTLSQVKFDLLLLAPACTIADFEAMRAKCGHRINDIRIFGMSDELEREDKCLSLLYPRSLLYLVSGLGETEADMPLLGMQRYFSGEAPYNTPELLSARKFLLDDPPQPRIVWSKSPTNAAAGRQSESKAHGDFDDDPPTRASLKQIIAHGYA